MSNAQTQSILFLTSPSLNPHLDHGHQLTESGIGALESDALPHPLEGESDLTDQPIFGDSVQEKRSDEFEQFIEELAIAVVENRVDDEPEDEADWDSQPHWEEWNDIQHENVDRALELCY